MLCARCNGQLRIYASTIEASGRRYKVCDDCIDYFHELVDSALNVVADAFIVNLKDGVEVSNDDED